MNELPTPTQDERSMGLLVHILGIFSGFLAPLIIYAVKRDSKFISFHALQSLFWHLLYSALVFVFAMGFVVVFFTSIASQIAHQPQQSAPGPPPAFIFIFPFFWLILMLFWVLNLVLEIILAVKANAGEWACMPLVGTWARRILKIDS